MNKTDLVRLLVFPTIAILVIVYLASVDDSHKQEATDLYSPATDTKLTDVMRQMIDENIQLPVLAYRNERPHLKGDFFIAYAGYQKGRIGNEAFRLGAVTDGDAYLKLRIDPSLIKKQFSNENITTTTGTAGIMVRFLPQGAWTPYTLEIGEWHEIKIDEFRELNEIPAAIHLDIVEADAQVTLSMDKSNMNPAR